TSTPVSKCADCEQKAQSSAQAPDLALINDSSSTSGPHQASRTRWASAMRAGNSSSGRRATASASSRVRERRSSSRARSAATRGTAAPCEGSPLTGLDGGPAYRPPCGDLQSGSVESGEVGGVVEAVQPPPGQPVAGVAEIDVARLPGPLGERRVPDPHVEGAPQRQVPECGEGALDHAAVADDHDRPAGVV